MNTDSIVIGQDLKNYTKDFVFFSNLNLAPDQTMDMFRPYINAICHEVDLSYKVPCSINFHSSEAIPNHFFASFLQYSDVIIRFRQVDQNYDLFVSLSSHLARTLLCRLLSTNLIDESQGLLFSSTEKGIFSFILTKLMYELKISLNDTMPNLKLLGVYNSQDTELKEIIIEGFGALNFIINLANQQYHLVLLAPADAIREKKLTFSKTSTLVNRLSNLIRILSFRLATLKIDILTLESLRNGDVILLDQKKTYDNNNLLSATIYAYWDDYFLRGKIFQHQDNYHFIPDKSCLWQGKENAVMEEIEITGAMRQDYFEHSTKKGARLSDLANNIRIQLHVELSRIPLTLKEACEIKEGTILDLNRKLDDALELVIEGKVIGYCAPIKIEGRLGIKVLKMMNEDETYD